LEMLEWMEASPEHRILVDLAAAIGVALRIKEASAVAPDGCLPSLRVCTRARWGPAQGVQRAPTATCASHSRFVAEDVHCAGITADAVLRRLN
jgi:hypothetical protein